MVNVLTDIKCPICRDRISGQSEGELSDMLRAHLVDIHRISRLEAPVTRERTSEQEGYFYSGSGRDPSMLTPQEARQREEVARYSTPPLGPESRVEREVETLRREPVGQSREAERTIQESDQWKYPRMETREEREVGTWRYGGRDMPSDREFTNRQEGDDRGYSRSTSGENPPMSDIRHGGTLHRMVNRREMTMSMPCPLCGNPVYGSDDEDLSDELRFHFKDHHQIRRR